MPAFRPGRYRPCKFRRDLHGLRNFYPESGVQRNDKILACHPQQRAFGLIENGKLAFVGRIEKWPNGQLRGGIAYSKTDREEGLFLSENGLPLKVVSQAREYRAWLRSRGEFFINKAGALALHTCAERHVHHMGGSAAETICQPR